MTFIYICSQVNLFKENETTRQADEDSFNFGISQGVRAIRIEQAMAERKIPPLLNPLINVDNNETLIPAMKRIMIVSTWRTGSSFLGELIQSVPGVFYSYEPLHFFDRHHGSKEDLIRSIFHCTFPSDYLRHISGLTEGGQDFMRRNRRVWEACNHDPSLCHRSEFVRRLCTYFPIQLTKVVRLRVRELAGILKEGDDLKWKIVYLARDPRGVMASRANLTWCKPDPACGDVHRLCADVKEDTELMKQLQTQFPDRFYLLKFEDLTSNVETETENLFRFLRLPVTVPVKVFLSTHTGSSPSATINKLADRRKNDPFSTSRQSKSVANEWRTKLTNAEVTAITNVCNTVLKMLDYVI